MNRVEGITKVNRSSRIINRIKSMILPTWLIRFVNPNAPKGVISDARRWINSMQSSSPRDPRYPPLGWYSDWDSPQIMILPPPILVGSRENEAPLNIRRIFITARTGIFMIKNARILGVDAAVMSPDGKVFSEFTYLPRGRGEYKIPEYRHFTSVTKLKGSYLTILFPSSYYGYYHWVAESIPRLRFAMDLIQALDGVFIPNKSSRFVTDSLIAFGFQESQFITLNSTIQYQCDQLFVPQYCGGLNIPPWVGEFLRSVLIKENVIHACTPFRRIFISREDAKYRRIINEEEFYPILQSEGFEIVRLAEMRFIDQARLFYEAKEIIAPHGAGLVNVLFSQPGVKVVEIMPSNDVLPHIYYNITSQIGGEYFYSIGEAVGPKVGRGDIDRSFILSRDNLTRILKALDGRK